MKYFSHYSVLLEECLSHLGNKGNEFPYLFADCTFGGGGHSLELLKRFSQARLIAFDQDPEAFVNGLEILKDKGYKNRSELHHENFSCFPELYSSNCFRSKDEKFDGILLDLGISSHHVDKAERGFSFRKEAPLDMRMNSADSTIETACDVVNTYSEEDLANIFFKYGEEKWARRIASKIIEERSRNEIKTTLDLDNIIFHCYPKKMRYGKSHPSTRSFQALRIYINKELQVIEEIIPKLFPLLKDQGVLAIISFHSLEDRIVKFAFKDLAKLENNCRIITKKPLVPGPIELEENSRSRSAKLRVVHKDSRNEEYGHKKKKYQKKYKV